MATYKRKRKLIKPALQLKMALVFLSTAGMAAVIQAIALTWSLGRLSERTGGTSSVVLDEIGGIITFNLLVTLAALVPIFLVVGVLVTFRIAGPVYRFETFLGQVARGEISSACRIRKGDEFVELCDRINEATEPLRSDIASRQAEATEITVDEAPSLVRESERSDVGAA